MLIAKLGHKHVPRYKPGALFNTVFAVSHLNNTGDDTKYFSTIIAVPDIGRIGPMQSYRSTLDFGQRPRALGLFRPKAACIVDQICHRRQSARRRYSRS